MVRVGETVTFTAEVSGEELSYQWESRSGILPWGDVASEIRPSLSVTPRSRTHSGTAYRLLASNAAGSVASDAARLTVAKARSRVEATLDKPRVQVGERAWVRVQVTAPGPRPTGQVRMLVNDSSVAVRWLDAGRVSVRLPGLQRGEHQVRADYLGSTNTARSSSGPMTLQVTR